MVTRTSDVNLVIRARNEADAAIKSVSGALQSLFSDAETAGDGVGDLGRSVVALDKAFGTISGSVDEADAALNRQRSAVVESKAALAALAVQASEARRVLDGFGNQADKGFVGPRTESFTKGYASVLAEAERLDRGILKLTGTVKAQEAGLATAQSSLLRLTANSNAVGQAQATAAARIALTTQALDEQATAAVRVSALQQRVNDATGINRTPVAGSAASAASILIEADNIFRRAEARKGEIVQLREAEAATAALADAQRAEQANRARLSISDDPRGAQARESASAFIAAADAEETMAREAAGLRAQLDPLGTIQERFNTQLARYRQLAAAGKISTDELARAEQFLTREANQASAALARVGSAGGATGKAPLFGLRPYELQNLGYQVNDVATQLASGTSLTQTLAQQSGQLLQIFPRVGSAIFNALKNPAVAGFVVTLGTIIAGLNEAGNQAARLRDFTSDLSFRATGGSYDAKGLAEAADALERMGAKAKDADAAIKAFLNEGVAPAAIADLGRAAQQTAERLGQDLPTAAKAAADAFVGGYDAVATFDDKLGFLTASEREHIRTLFESGNAEAARTEARLAYQRTEDDVAAKSKGPWQQAARSLGNAWDALVKFIADTAPIKATIAVLNALARATKDVGDAIDKALSDDKPKSATQTSKIARAQAQVKQLETQIAEYDQAIASGSPVAGTLTRLVENARQRLATVRAELTRLERSAPDTLGNDPNGRAAKVRADRLSQIDLEQQIQALRDRSQAGLTAADGRRRAQLAGELAYRAEIKSTGDEIIAGRLREIAVAKEAGEVDKTNAAARKRAEREGRETKFIAPTAGPVTSGFGPRKSPGGVGSKFHRGVDYDGEVGDRVNATAAGTVVETGYDAKLGKYVLIDHGNKVQSKYGHLSDNSVVAAGDKVTAGQRIGALGNTGTATTGSHLHFIVTVNGKAVNPAKNGGKFKIDPSDAGESYVNDAADLEDDRADKQDDLNFAIGKEAEQRDRATAALQAQAGLYGTALIAEQRRQAVAQAAADLQQRVADANRGLKPGQEVLTVTPAQVAVAERLAGALFDAQNAGSLLKARLDDAQRPLNALETQAGTLRDRFDALRAAGDRAGAEVVATELGDVNAKIRAATDALIVFYETLTAADRVGLGIVDQAQLDNLIAKLRLAADLAKAGDVRASVEARLTDLESPLQGYEDRADILRERIEFLRSMGDLSGVEKVSAELDGVNVKIQSSIDLLVAFYEGLTPDERNALGVTADAVDNIIDKLKVLRDRSREWGRVMGVSTKDIAQSLSSGMASSFNNFIRKVAEGKNVFKALGEGVREFAANFILSIAQMIIQLLAYAAAMSILRALRAPVPASTGAGVFHGGGIAGQAGGVRRLVDPAMFAGAARMHSGGVVGFKPNEVPIIAERGEEILTRADVRHRANGGLGGGGVPSPVNVKVVNAIDAGDFVSKGADTPAGTRAILNLIKANKGAVQTILNR